VWDNGLWFSNSTYKARVFYSKYSVGSKGKEWWDNGDYSYMLSDEYLANDLHGYLAHDDAIDEGFECYNPDCGIVWSATSESAVGGICRSCKHCIDCGDSKSECMCYNPKGNKWVVNGKTSRVGY